jgi:hypothetical protein
MEQDIPQSNSSDSPPPNFKNPQTNEHLILYFSELVQRSEDFNNNIIEFPTNNNRIKELGKNDAKKAQIAQHARDTKVIVHPRVKTLIEKFIQYKKTDGTEKERRIYENMTTDGFVERALRCRPLTFFGINDITFLRNGDLDMPPAHDWNRVGTESEGKMSITEYMTYDEIAISAFIGVSVPTLFINKGGRINRGNIDDDHLKESYGIYVALTGARFERRDKMESMHMLVRSDFTTKDSGYGCHADPNSKEFKLLQIWAEFYDIKLKQDVLGFPSFDEVSEAKNQQDENAPKPAWDPSHFEAHVPNSYTPIVYINWYIYKKRIQYILEPFLEEANNRAQEEKKKAYVHAIGLGLGVWQICPQQAQWMIEVYKDILSTGNFDHIAVIDFSWFPDNIDCEPEIKTNKGQHIIQIKFSKRDPAEKLDNPDHLLVAMYAWDGNSYPGNEYWKGMLHASGDPAAACCSTISELQNPEINKEFISKISWIEKSKPHSNL